MSNKRLYKKAVETFGNKVQLEVMVEECSELIHAIQKHKRAPYNKERANRVAEEVADVEIVCSQMRLLFPGIPQYKKHKLERLEERIQKTNDLREQTDRNMAAEEGIADAWNSDKGRN